MYQGEINANSPMVDKIELWTSESIVCVKKLRCLYSIMVRRNPEIKKDYNSEL